MNPSLPAWEWTPAPVSEEKSVTVRALGDLLTSSFKQGAIKCSKLRKSLEDLQNNVRDTLESSSLLLASTKAGGGMAFFSDAFKEDIPSERHSSLITSESSAASSGDFQGGRLCPSCSQTAGEKRTPRPARVTSECRHCGPPLRRPRTAGGGMQDSVRRGRLGGSLANGSGLSVDELKAVLSPLAGETDLKYIQVGPMSECIKACLAAQGFRQVPQDSCTDWRLAWGSTLPAARLAVMRATQAHNHIPGWHRLNNKGMLAEMAEQSRARGQRLANHVPRSFVLPAHLPDLLRDSSERGGPYIVKPIGGTRGRGIQVHARLDEGMLRGLSGVVVQRYITDCHLIGDRKYDLRLYVAATSTCPMRLYMHQEGYARFCSEKYDLARLHDLFRHVTNSNFQKFHKAYDLSSESSRAHAEGNKWHLDAVKLEWRKLGPQMDEVILSRIQEAVVGVFVMFEAASYEENRRVMATKCNNFCLFGIDVMLDSKLQPWLLELNGVPSTGTDSPIDIDIKTCVISDLLSLVGLCSRCPSVACKQAEQELYRSLAKGAAGGSAGTGSTGRGSQGGRSASRRVGTGRGRGRGGAQGVFDAEIIREQLETVMKRKVTGEHVELVLEWEREQARCRGWVACFPCPSMGRYSTHLRYREANDVMLAWMKTQMLR